MADVLTRQKRSEVMARIQSRGNKQTEIALLNLFRRHKIAGWRRHLPLPGRPDFTFRKAHIVVFVDGCFWHGCAKHCRMPKSNAAFWRGKISRNRARDKLVTAELRKRGWRVLRIWEHGLHQTSRVVARILAALSCSPRSRWLR